MSSLTLYSWPESGNSYKVRLLASILQIPYSLRDLDFLNLEQQGAAFTAINPKGEVPTLVVDDGKLVFTDSTTILTYLAATHPDSGRTTLPSSG
ncbi:hypothetical protein NLG97_g6288 [Lecanicillium saksenae]|uniref:Uncharacterized protein n=1 Tax=Lecanicillium saksenae TaxID=468837 RepID=A0ACC1QTV1_9HYPO|nr:hypothetical protein NLG97_g6288 [Lecanicillium saksenae]